MVEIKKLAASRWKDYKRLRLESLKLSPLAFGSAYEEEAGLGEKEWKKHMKEVRFAMDGGVPVGMITCSFNRKVKFGHIAEIFGFYVRAGYRGKGVGAALLDHALQLARSNRGVVKVRLYVNSRQRAAYRLYEKSGFVMVAKFDREMKVGMRYYAMLAMEKAIR